jgi:hypothetical protein
MVRDGRRQVFQLPQLGVTGSTQSTAASVPTPPMPNVQKNAFDIARNNLIEQILKMRLKFVHPNHQIDDGMIDSQISLSLSLSLSPYLHKHTYIHARKA